MPYSEVGASVGDENCLHAYMRVEDDDVNDIEWTSGGLTGDICSPNEWAECSLDEHCSGSEYCDSNSCEWLICGIPYVQSNHTCVLAPGNCVVNEDCNSNEECISYICTELDCDTPEVPGEHECVLPEGACHSNDDCPSYEKCTYGSCVGVGDYCGYIVNHILYDYECCEDSDCTSAEFECTSHECVLKPGACLSDDDCPSHAICTDAIDYNRCIYLACESYEIVGDHECVLKEGACYDDGDCLEGEECESVGCMPSSWNDCICTGGENIGTQAGTCTDNCEEELEFEQACECEIEEEPPEPSTPTQEQLDAEEAIQDAEEAIEEAEEEEEEVSEAEEKLEQAHEAYDSGNYELAEELALEAHALASEEEPEWWEDTTTLILIGLVGLGIVVGLVILYLIASKIFGGRKPEGKKPKHLKPKVKKLKKRKKKSKR